MQPVPEEKIVEIIRSQVSRLEAVYLFGSRATDAATKDSDWDIAFLTDHKIKIPTSEIFELKKNLETALHADVDLIHLNSASTVFQFQIVNYGSPLFLADETRVLQFEALVLSQYQRLNEERKDILNSIASSGRVYAKG